MNMISALHLPAISTYLFRSQNGLHYAYYSLIGSVLNWPIQYESSKTNSLSLEEDHLWGKRDVVDNLELKLELKFSKQPLIFAHFNLNHI